jgi:hypothetical protein
MSSSPFAAHTYETLDVLREMHPRGNRTRGPQVSIPLPGKGRPVLLWEDGSHVTQRDAIEYLGFAYINLWSGRVLKNATDIL